MTSAGFGAPGRPGAVEQPKGGPRAEEAVQRAITALAGHAFSPR